jgi:DNA polymerase III alpha subunit (gram-positive type)
MKKHWIVFAILWIFIGLLGSISLFAAENEPENPDCTAGTEFCEQNSLDTTNNTTTSNTNVNTNTNNNTSTSTATNTNNNTNNTTTTATATNTNNNNNTSTNANTNVNTSTATTTATTSNTNQNNNTNVNTSTSNSTVTSTVNQSVASTSTTDNTNTSVNTSTSTSDNTNTNVNQSTSESNVKTDNTNTNVNQSTTENTNRNINESSSTQRIEQDIKTEAPPASAIAPSIMSYSQDLCTTGRSGAFQGQLFGISGGRTVTDENCERLKLSKYIYDMGMKVAAISILCQDKRVFAAMEMAGTPCPYMGKIGKEATLGWQENRIERPDYKEKKAMFLKKCALDKNPKDSGYRKDVVSGVRKVFTKKNKTAKQCKREWQNAS